MRPTDVRPFVATGNTVTIAATSASTATAITQANQKNSELPGTMRVHNAGTGMAFIAQGSSSAVVAATTDIPVPTGASPMTFEMRADTTYVAAITSASSVTATLYFTPGQGISS